MHNREQTESIPQDGYSVIEPAILRSARQAVQEKGIESLRVDELSEDDLNNIPWSGSSLHVKEVGKELIRAKTGDVDYLAVRSPEGYPVSIGGVDYAKESNGGYLWQLGTHEQLRGLGIGTRLIREAERRILERGAEWARLEVETDNPRAKELYERLGYEVYGTGVDSWKQLDKDGKEVMHVADVFLMRKRVKV